MTDQIVAGGHIRLRPFNTADTYPEQNISTTTSARPWWRATRCTCAARSRRIWTPARASRSATRPARPRRRWTTSSCCWARPGRALEHICKATVYLTDIRYREPVYRVLGERMKGVYPAFTGLVVPALARPEWVVEVDVTAVIA